MVKREVHGLGQGTILLASCGTTYHFGIQLKVIQLLLKS